MEGEKESQSIMVYYNIEINNKHIRLFKKEY